MSNILQNIARKVTQALKEPPGESFMDSQCRHVFYYFLMIAFSSFPLFLFVVQPSTKYFFAVNAVFFIIEVVLSLLWLFGKIPLKKVFIAMIIFMQLEICCENVICAFNMVEYPRLLIMANTLLSFMFIVVAACAYLDATSMVLGGIALLGFTLGAIVTHGPYLLHYIFLIVILLIFASILGKTLRRNALRMENDNNVLKAEEREVLKFLQISRQDLFALIELSSKQQTGDVANTLIETLGPKAKENIFTAFHAHSLSERTQLERIKTAFPELSSSEQVICRLILQDKSISEICEILSKSTGNITSQRTHIRAKLGLKREDNLKDVLQKRLNF